MRSFAFHPGPRVLAGAGRAIELASVMPQGPCLFVSDERLVELGLTDGCREALASSGIDPILFDSVEADPSKETLLAAVEAARAAGVRSVIGFGGGSPMDVAKLAAYLLGSGDQLDDIWGARRAPAAGPGADDGRNGL
jgi:alcohol dehydrogenase class IV